MKPQASPSQETAVVVGASMAGLLAVRVLSSYYKQVTLIDRDVLGTSVENRRGVPQGKHTHGLLAGGRLVLEDLFPGLTDQLLQAGALIGDIVGESRWFLEGACHTRVPSGLRGLLMSRPFLESAVRARVRNIANVEFREGVQVGGLVLSADNKRVVGVKMGSEVLASDLIVDTTGRGSRSQEWLASAGYPTPPEERLEVAVAYTTRFFRRTLDQLNGDLAAIIPPTPLGKRGGVMLAQEGDRWTVTLISHFGPAAPMELSGFVDFAKTLPAPYIFHVIRGAEPLGDALSARFPASVRRRYEKLDRFPEGYLVMGDAISSFNPIYGQGMSVAALQSQALEQALSEGPHKLAPRFFQRASKVIDVPWSIAAGNDLRMPEATGPRTPAVKFTNAYIARLHKAAHRDPVVAVAFHQVGNLVKPPTHILHPRIAVRVLLGNLRKPSGAAPSGQHDEAEVAH
jgi:2-polyprenyl-6-methoxyphenol hydroxylase-like FAD-dependent oxidoreductase